jgi:hypothetical protein
MLLTCAITISLLSLAPIADAGRFSNPWRGTIQAALMFALAILLKGPIGLALPLSTMAVWLVYSDLRDRRIANCKLQIANCRLQAEDRPTSTRGQMQAFLQFACNLQFAICNLQWS